MSLCILKKAVDTVLLSSNVVVLEAWDTAFSIVALGGYGVVGWDSER